MLRAAIRGSSSSSLLRATAASLPGFYRGATIHTVVAHVPPSGAPTPPSVPEGCKPIFAVIALGGTQHKVTVDDTIVSEKLRNCKVGERLNAPEVLLVGRRDKTWVGRPIVPGAKVEMVVQEQTKDAKVVVFKKRRRKSSKTKQGHRREVTILHVTSISPPPSVNEED
eukprot:55283_1